MNEILYGNAKGRDAIDEEEVSMANIDRWYTLEHGGLTHLIKRCFNDSISENMRRWAEEFMEKTTCDSCNGTRLKMSRCILKLQKKISVKLYSWILMKH